VEETNKGGGMTKQSVGKLEWNKWRKEKINKGGNGWKRLVSLNCGFRMGHRDLARLSWQRVPASTNMDPAFDTRSLHGLQHHPWGNSDVKQASDKFTPTPSTNSFFLWNQTIHQSSGKLALDNFATQFNPYPLTQFYYYNRI
jgi:hypothetical protein